MNTLKNVNPRELNQQVKKMQKCKTCLCNLQKDKIIKTLKSIKTNQQEE